MSKKLWSGRFSSHTHPDVEQYTASISFDCELAFEDILGSLAHADMLKRCNIISPDDHSQLQKGLTQIASKLANGEISFRIEDEDIHMNIERLLSENIGEVAGKLHTARSRNDQVALDMHLYLRKQIVIIVELLTQLQDTLLSMAQTHRHVIVPGYTHLQRAQPIYLAQHWLAYVAMLQRDVARLQDSWSRVNLSPLGAAALAGTHFRTDKQYVAAELGFDGIYSNTLDAVSDRDFVIEFLSHASIIMMHLSRLSEELVLWSSQEFNFISFDDAYCTGSSIMPQKKNPDVVELGRGKTGRVYGALFTLLTILKGLPLAYNKDLQEDKEPVFDVVKTLCQTLAIYSPLLSTLKINPEKMRQAANEGYLNATALAEYLVGKGLTFRAAHEVVGKMVAHCLNKNCCLEDLSIDEMQQFSSHITENVYQILSIENAVSASNLGNSSESLLDSQLALYGQQVYECQSWVSETKAFLSAIYIKFGLTLYPQNIPKEKTHNKSYY